VTDSRSVDEVCRRCGFRVRGPRATSEELALLHPDRGPICLSCLNELLARYSAGVNGRRLAIAK
jgi:hypothetical protein